MAKRITVDVPDWEADQAVEVLKRLPLLLSDPRSEPLLPEPEDLLMEHEAPRWRDEDRLYLAADDDLVSLTEAIG